MSNSRGDAAIELILFAEQKGLSDGDAAAAFILAACFLAGGDRNNLFSLIRLITEADEIVTGPENAAAA